MKPTSSTSLVYAQTQLNQPDGMTYQELISTVSTMIVAGSETTATLLSGVTYYLLTNPPILAELTAEIRNAFQSEADITMTSVNNLNYTLAVCKSLSGGSPAPKPYGSLNVQLSLTLWSGVLCSYIERLLTPNFCRS
jgi:hypothetical protein